MQISSKLFPARRIALPTRSISSPTFASSLYTGMTTDTCSGALCGSTPQSSRRGGEAANADRALECIGLRIAALRMTDDEASRAHGQEKRDGPLHRRPRAEARAAPRERKRNDRRQPAAKGAGEDVERPVHA